VVKHILGTFESAMIIGSMAGVIIAIISSILMSIRTKMGDDVLQAELKGCKPYSKSYIKAVSVDLASVCDFFQLNIKSNYLFVYYSEVQYFAGHWQLAG
jgi:hypothetical protein